MQTASETKLSQKQIENVKKAIEHIKNAKEAITDALDIPFAAPGDKEYDDFWKRPGIHTLFRLSFMLDDTEKFSLPLIAP